jgi:hypothetical protein
MGEFFLTGKRFSMVTEKKICCFAQQVVFKRDFHPTSNNARTAVSGSELKL